MVDFSPNNAYYKPVFGFFIKPFIMLIRDEYMLRLKLAVVFAALITVFSLTVNAGYIEKRGDKTIIHVKLYSVPDASRTDTFSRASMAVFNLFKKRFPEIFAKKYAAKYKADPKTYGKYNWDNVEIQMDSFTGIRVEGVESDLLAIAGGMAPDVLYVNFRKSDNYIQSGFLYPLNKESDNYFTSLTPEQIAFRINPKIMPVIDRKGPNGQKHIWAMPQGGALGKVLLYRKDLFDENKISYPNKDWTWEDMMAAAKKMTDPEKGIYGLALGRGKHESWFWVTYLWSAGGEAMVYNEEKDQWKCVFDTKEAAEALDFYIRLSAEKWIDPKGKIRRGYSSKDAADKNVKWDRGEIGMNFGYVDEKLFSTIDPEVTGMAPVPLGPPCGPENKRIRGAELNSRMVGLFAEIKDRAVRDAAWEYIEFMGSKEAMALSTKIMVEGGLGRFINPKYLKMFGYPEIERLCPKGWSETFNIAIETGKPEPYGRNSNVAYDMMTFPIQEAEALARNDQLPENKEERIAILQEILKKHCANANEKMIGIITPQERTVRRICAVVLLVFLSIAFFFVFRKIFKAFTPENTVVDGKKKSWNFRKYFWAYILLVPAILTVFTWQYVPLIRGSYMAFFDYQILRDSIFVGVDNFGDLLWDGDWWASVWNALRYSFLVLTMTFLPPIMLAILLQEVPKGKLLFRTIYYLPAVITGLVTVVLWKQFFDPSDSGMLNMVMLKIPAIGFIIVGALAAGVAFMFARRLCFYELYWPMVGFIVAGIILFFAFASLAGPILFPVSETFSQALAHIPSNLIKVSPEPYNWLSDPDTSMVACVLPMVWAGMGPGCLIYLAALKGIPDDYYEAADIDGATFIDKILFVVCPTLKALIIINFVGAFIQSFYRATGNIMVMTGGGAGTETAGLHIWYKAFTYLKFGPATAMAWMLGFMLIGFTVHQLRILSRVEFRTTGKKE
jgi:multiple sugar transport system permease protein